MADPGPGDIVTTGVTSESAPARAETRICIAPMRRRHLRSVLTIEAAVNPKPWSMNLFIGELAKPESRSYLVARSGAVVVGHAGVLFIEDEGHLTTISVDPVWQRRQIATRLMLAQLRRSREHGATAMTLEVRVANRGAQELYRHFGFAPAGIRKGYYAESGEDALIMWVHDIGSDAMIDRLACIESGVLGATTFEERRGE